MVMCFAVILSGSCGSGVAQPPRAYSIDGDPDRGRDESVAIAELILDVVSDRCLAGLRSTRVAVEAGRPTPLKTPGFLDTDYLISLEDFTGGRVRAPRGVVRLQMTTFEEDPSATVARIDVAVVTGSTESGEMWRRIHDNCLRMGLDMQEDGGGGLTLTPDLRRELGREINVHVAPGAVVIQVDASPQTR